MTNWIKDRIKKEQVGMARLIVLGSLVLILSPLAKIDAGIAIAYGIWTIVKKG